MFHCYYMSVEREITLEDTIANIHDNISKNIEDTINEHANTTTTYCDPSQGSSESEDVKGASTCPDTEIEKCHRGYFGVVLWLTWWISTEPYRHHSSNNYRDGSDHNQ